MSLKHAANRFRRTRVDGWDGTRWIEGVTRGTFMTNDRFISDREFGNKLRNLMIHPEQPLPPEISVVRIGGDENIFLVGRNSPDIKESVYSIIVTLRRAYYTCTVMAYSSQKAASGMKTAAVRTVVGEFHCDREHITFAASKEFPSVKFGDELVILPADTPVDTTNEIVIENKSYEVEEIYDFSGLKYCRCIVRSTPRSDQPFAGSAKVASTVQGELTNDLYQHPYAGDVVADSVAEGDITE
jgi:hypothetical protein